MELLHQPGDIITERYRIIDILGQGGVGTTYEAQDLENDRRVAIKVLSFRHMTDWKKMELFEREARILSQLNHPSIPRYLDYFQVDTEQDRSFYIAQQLAPGKSLAVLVENGWIPTQSEIHNFAIKLLKILIYLQEFTPPIIHRDIKPQNIIRQEDGQVFLVDFGAVQDTYHNTVTGGSTVVGTYGYMAPEQFRGQAVLSTDLYGLATTLLFLLTQKPPSELPQRKLKIDFRSQLRLEKKFADWLEKMLEPVIEDRFSSAKEALAVLRGEQAFTNYSTQKLHQPKGSPIKLTNVEGRLLVEIPPVWLRSNHSQFFGLLTLIWNGIFWLPLFAFGMDLPLTGLGVILLLIFRLFGFLMLPFFLVRAADRKRLEIDQHNFQLRWWLGNSCISKVQGRTENLNFVKQRSPLVYLSKNPMTFCVLKLKSRSHLFGSLSHRFGLFLTEPEKEWLVSEINNFLDKMRNVTPQNQIPIDNNPPEDTAKSNKAYKPQKNDRNQLKKELQQKLLTLVHRDKSLADRLLDSARINNPGHSEDWYWEKVIYDLERDHRY